MARQLSGPDRPSRGPTGLIDRELSPGVSLPMRQSAGEGCGQPQVQFAVLGQSHDHLQLIRTKSGGAEDRDPVGQRAELRFCRRGGCRPRPAAPRGRAYPVVLAGVGTPRPARPTPAATVGRPDRDRARVATEPTGPDGRWRSGAAVRPGVGPWRSAERRSWLVVSSRSSASRSTRQGRGLIARSAGNARPEPPTAPRRASVMICSNGQTLCCGDQGSSARPIPVIAAVTSAGQPGRGPERDARTDAVAESGRDPGSVRAAGTMTGPATVRPAGGDDHDFGRRTGRAADRRADRPARRPGGRRGRRGAGAGSSCRRA